MPAVCKGISWLAPWATRAVATTEGIGNQSTPPRNAVKIALRQLERDLVLTPDKQPRQPSRSRSPALRLAARRLPAPPLAYADTDTETEPDSAASTVVYSPVAGSPELEDHE